MGAEMRGVLSALTLTLLTALPASATVTFTYTGFVSNGYDQTGIFGTPNTSLTGDAFSLVFSTNGTPTNPGNGFIEIAGEISAILSINGHPYNLPGAAGGFNFIEISPMISVFSSGTNDVNPYQFPVPTKNIVQFTAIGAASPQSPIKSFSYSLGPQTDFNLGGTTQSGGLFIDCSNCEADGVANAGGYTNYAYLESFLDGGSGPLGSVPEPSTWAMTLIGFAAIGFGLYRREPRDGLADQPTLGAPAHANTLSNLDRHL
jgi:PEP-CTERM motif